MTNTAPSDPEADAAGTERPDDAAASADDAPRGEQSGAPGTGRIPPEAAGAAGPDASAGGTGSRFYDGLRSFGIERRAGWLGGVCAGIAARLGIDPLIVRGVAVVAAVLAAPVFFLYAAGWLLLPDTDGRIHLERLLRGKFDPALIGIGLLLLASFFPVTQAFWSVASPIVLSGPWWPISSVIAPAAVGFWNVLVSLAIVGLIIWVIVTATKNSRGGGSVPAARTASAPGAAAAPGTTPAPSSAAFTAPVEPAPAEPAPPAEPGAAGETYADFEEWKRAQDAWRADVADWKRRQADADRAARAQWAAENRARAAELRVAGDAARAARRAANPRTSFAFVALALGTALVAGTAVALFSLGESPVADYAGTLGVLVAAGVTGFAMVIAGVIRRRSGFLAWISMTLLVIGLISAAIPRTGELVGVTAWAQPVAGETRSLVQPLGSLSITADARNGLNGDPSSLEVQKIWGDTNINVYGDLTVVITATLQNGNLSMFSSDYDGNPIEAGEITRESVNGVDHHRVVLGDPTRVPDLTIDLTQSTGSVWIQYMELEASTSQQMSPGAQLEMTPEVQLPMTTEGVTR
ncbi:PspC domain-containing protein [Agromyces atrinae]|uniref:PspC domain-containing protein n=1 Tax=Agromyces atrinae TaxID=592376 RepID=UPI001F58734E|nr:PspC domain-containing protein [Agromyces atrinae]MCI2957404.1 PspC domain-containing protein [Agromyces atrinae]